MWRELLPNTAASRDAAVATASTALWATAAWLSADVAWSHGKVSPTWNASADSHEKELPPQSSRHAKQLKRPTPVPEGPQAGMAGMQHSSVSLRVTAKAEAAVRTSPVCVRKNTGPQNQPTKKNNIKQLCHHPSALNSPQPARLSANAACCASLAQKMQGTQKLWACAEICTPRFTSLPRVFFAGYTCVLRRPDITF